MARLPREHEAAFCAMAAYLRAQDFPSSLAHLRVVVYDLVRAEGTRFVNGSVCVEGSSLAVDKMVDDSQLQDAVQESDDAILNMLRLVASRLRELATEVLHHLKSKSVKSFHFVDGEPVGDCYLVYQGEPDGDDREWIMDVAQSNRARLDDCALLGWFLSLALRPIVC